jgi:hypothetical protein
VNTAFPDGTPKLPGWLQRQLTEQVEEMSRANALDTDIRQAIVKSLRDGGTPDQDVEVHLEQFIALSDEEKQKARKDILFDLKWPSFPIIACTALGAIPVGLIVRAFIGGQYVITTTWGIIAILGWHLNAAYLDRLSLGKLLKCRDERRHLSIALWKVFGLIASSFVACLLALLKTNPDEAKFAQYLEAVGKKEHSREALNVYILTLYTAESDSGSKEKYIGALDHFYRME